jgi:hypothetical protein
MALIGRDEKQQGCSDTPPWAPPAPSANKYHSVIINRVENGFIIHVGCKCFVGKEWGEVASGLAEYWADPVAAEKKHCVKEAHKHEEKNFEDEDKGMEGKACPFL